MKSISAKDLKNHTAEVLRRVRGGEKFVITRRGKPEAVLSPTDGEHVPTPGLRPYEEAWKEIEMTLRVTRVRHKTWKEALRWLRRRGTIEKHDPGLPASCPGTPATSLTVCPYHA